jgi:hypothetical protein
MHTLSQMNVQGVHSLRNDASLSEVLGHAYFILDKCAEYAST